jgi:hypothetical protein
MVQGGSDRSFSTMTSHVPAIIIAIAKYTTKRLLPLLGLTLSYSPHIYQTLLHLPTNHTSQHASQRRRLIRQRPHRGPAGRPRQLWRRTSSPLFLLPLTNKPQATLQHTKNNVAPMPEIEKGEGMTPPSQPTHEEWELTQTNSPRGNERFRRRYSPQGRGCRPGQGYRQQPGFQISLSSHFLAERT